MLTKDLLKFRRRGDRIIPTLVPPQDIDRLALSRKCVEIFQSSIGQTWESLQKSTDEIYFKDVDFKNGLVKLLFDHAEFDEEDSSVGSFRWDAIMSAQAVRNSITKDLSISDYSQTVEELIKIPRSSLQERIYSDLPEHKKLKIFDSLNPEALIHRYNAAQVQGLLLHAKEITLDIEETDLVIKRALLRCVKFHQLIAEMEKIQGGFRLILTGPLSLFQNAQTYGLKMAHFFPYVLQLPKWILRAAIEWNKKPLILVLDQDSGIRSHYKSLSGYIPEEWHDVIRAFNTEYSPLQAQLSDEFVFIGRQSYSFPDITVSPGEGPPIHFELFHRWHAGQLRKRLDALAMNPVDNLRIGVCKSITKDPAVIESLKTSTWFFRFGFQFSDFPTPKQLHSACLK